MVLSCAMDLSGGNILTLFELVQPFSGTGFRDCANIFVRVMIVGERDAALIALIQLLGA
jgi:hypothetical protein